MARMNFRHNGETLTIITDTYQNNGALAVKVVDEYGLPYATLSVNLPESSDLPHDSFYLKAYAENEAVVKSAIDDGVIEANPHIRPASLGFGNSAEVFTLVPWD